MFKSPLCWVLSDFFVVGFGATQVWLSSLLA
jgi:hypothetical protein